MTSERWRHLVNQEGRRISWRYQHKAALLSLQGRWQTYFARRVERKYGPEIAATPARAPIFILGHYRSGTTYLHELLALDPRFASPTRFQAYHPASFLATERWFAGLNDLFMLPRRVQEDEIALMNLTGLSPYLDWCWPESVIDYSRYLTFRRAGEAEASAWTRALRWYLSALTIRYRKPILLKSPPHTARIRLILRAFPDARFVHIRRNPYDVFVSTVRLLRDIDPVFRLRVRHQPISEEGVLQIYQEMYDDFFDAVPTIPPGQFTEIAYEALELDPVGQLRTIYRDIDLGDFATIEPVVARYLAGVEGYQKNRHPEIDPVQRRLIAARWATAFARWGYPT